MNNKTDKINEGLMLFYRQQPSDRGYREDISLKNLLYLGGVETGIYGFDMECLDEANHNPGKFVLRLYPDKNSIRDSKKEYLVMQELKRIGYPVPNVYFWESDCSYFNGPFLIMERIDGPTMWNTFESAAAGKKEEILYRFIRLLVRLHNLDVGALSPVLTGYSRFMPEPSQVDVDIDLNDTALLAMTGINFIENVVLHYNRKDLLPIIEWLKQQTGTVSFEKPSLIHFDFHPENVLISTDNVPYVIDWGGWEIFDYRFDLAETLFLIEDYFGRKYSDMCLRFYGQISGWEISHLEFFQTGVILIKIVRIIASLVETDVPEMGIRKINVELSENRIRYLHEAFSRLQVVTRLELPGLNGILHDLENKLAVKLL